MNMNYLDKFDVVKNKYFTICDLIKHLQKFDQNLPIGQVGHFGEFLPFDKSNFNYVRTCMHPDGLKVMCAEISDLGEGPD